ncbi:hypothetical protein HKCCSP123_16340 [Rhodobacterales bacterium HKCCSP123]|nr:hypothetical protein [Rhodobacterales bacterium HKCCSP123]
MAATRLEAAQSAAALLHRDLLFLEVSLREVEEATGIKKSTLNDFINVASTKRGPQKRTLQKLLEIVALEADTRQALQLLLHWDKIALRNKLRIEPLLHAAE